MTKFYETKTFDKEHVHSGGVILPSDFNTDYRRKVNEERGSFVASRILSDFRREKKMLINTKNKQTNWRKNSAS